MDYRAALVGIKFLLAKRRTLRKANDLNINLKKEELNTQIFLQP